MKTLSTEFRRHLERTVIEARDVAESGARVALEGLAVHHHEPYEHMTPGQRTLRRRLRAHARQLGDRLDARSGVHAINRLVHECAFEHWHGMLFARFLAENHLLIEPEMGVAISLDECEELAKEEGVDKWALASRFAHRMLPQVFRPDHPVFEVQFAREHRLKLEGLVEGLPADVFKATDSLGWVYQFWQTREKEEVNRSEVKIGAAELPAVTQLFTEPYMVQFLLHNSLGAWWVEQHGAESLPIEMPCLRFLDDGTPAAGTFDGWPKSAAALKVLDPCCGSGHFLVAAFEILVRFRMTEAGLGPAEACDAVLRDNLHGLEIDERCTQIAAFVLALAAWTFPGASGYRVLPEMHIACSGLAPQANKSEWLALAGDDYRIRGGMERMHGLFGNAPLLGSLIDPTHQQPNPLLVARFAELEPILSRALKAEGRVDIDRQERRVAAAGVAKAGELLAAHYHLVATNVPYLLRRKQHPQLLRFLKDNHADAVNDLGIAFADRAQRFLCDHGCTALVLPQSFIELRSYQVLRRRLLSDETWRFVARIGPGAFQMISGEVVNICLILLERSSPAAGHIIWSINVNDENGTAAKAAGLRSKRLDEVKQTDIKAGPEARFTLLTAGKFFRLGEVAATSWGISPADLPQFGRFFWEFRTVRKPWICWQSSFKVTTPYAGRKLLLNMGPELEAVIDTARRSCGVHSTGAGLPW